MSRDCQAIIRLSALTHNLDVIRQRAPQSRIAAVIKADAYGHGILPVAQALQTADMLAVATLDEAVHLRMAHIASDILILEGYHSSTELACCQQHNLIPVIHAQHQLVLLDKHTVRLNKAWLKVETGMHRLGFEPENARVAYHQLRALGIDVVWMTHMANADSENDPLNSQQLNHFDQTVASLPAMHSVANSAAAWAIPEARRDWIRPGIMLYGISPFVSSDGSDFGLQPVMQLQSDLISIKACRAGDRIGYGGRYQCDSDTSIGILAIGYGDGYPRQALDGTPIWLNGRQVSLVGMPSMDMLAVDLGADTQDCIGDKAELWGDHISVEQVAAMSGTIAYELTCKILPRVERVIIQ